MTIEFALRRRAAFARWLAALWLLLSVTILVSTYFSLPTVAKATLTAIGVHSGASPAVIGKDLSPAAGEQATLPRAFALVTLCAAIVAIAGACFLLARAAFIEVELAVRYVSLADAICLSGANVANLERVAALLVPKPRYFSDPQTFSPKDLKALAEIIKQAKALPATGE